VYPALAVVDALEDRAELLWIGGEAGMEEALVRRAGVEFAAIPAAGLHGVGWRALPGNLLRLLRGYFAARRVVRRFRPQAMFFTGGYVAVPVALAGARIPKAIFVPDIEPGLALRLVSRLSRLVMVTSEGSRRYYRRHKQVVATGYPVRSELKSFNRASGRTALGLEQDRAVVLAFGGSRGARSINHALWNCLPALLKRCQVVHITGELDWPEVDRVRSELAPDLVPSYRAFPYLHEEMGAALAAADLVVSRAGASTMGEFPVFGLPAILVPYPHAWRYQKVNAEYLASQGAAVELMDENLEETLLPTVLALLDDRKRLEAMAAAARALAVPHAAAAIADELLALGWEKDGQHG
jgi:UDP-N-acetylglucosamine--N-acetylmuramyl-(pentapeptide) pyrophosphoryl-undecaprenol N-acetylglucosamine transferase